MLNFTNITGKKETKGFDSAIVQATATSGDFKISPLAAQALGVKAGDFLVFQNAADSEGQYAGTYIGKGITGVAKTNEDGTVAKNKIGRTLYEDNTGWGAVTAPYAEGSTNLKVSGSMAWKALGGDSENLFDFELGEAVSVSLPTDLKDENGEVVMCSTTLFPLVLKEKKAKQAKGPKTEGVAKSEEVASTPIGVASEAVSEDFDSSEEFTSEEV